MVIGGKERSPGDRGLAVVRRGSDKEGLYDTSRCNVKFRRPRILQSRSLTFDHRRKLGFDANRKIRARLNGVIFRREAAVGFRNVGISNLEDVMDRTDWPNVGQASPPDTLKVERRDGWAKTWGRDKGYKDKWGSQPSRKPEGPKEGEADGEEDQEVFRVSTGKGKDRSERTAITLEPVSPVTRTDPVMRKKALAFNEYALQLMESGEYVRARSYFQKAIELDPEEQVYVTNLERCQKWMDYYKRGGRQV